jgi:hypothetical protein
MEISIRHLSSGPSLSPGFCWTAKYKGLLSGSQVLVDLAIRDPEIRQFYVEMTKKRKKLAMSLRYGGLGLSSSQ